jgi:hypothetical protein
MPRRGCFLPVTDPARRFCVQCGCRNVEHSREDKARCYDCAGVVVPARFCARTGARVDPLPEARAILISSYAGRSYGDGITSIMPGVGAFRTPMNEGLSSRSTRGRL